MYIEYNWENITKFLSKILFLKLNIKNFIISFVKHNYSKRSQHTLHFFLSMTNELELLEFFHNNQQNINDGSFVWGHFASTYDHKLEHNKEHNQTNFSYLKVHAPFISLLSFPITYFIEKIAILISNVHCKLTWDYAYNR